MPHHPTIPPPPKPTRIFFDPFNSSSTGHQRAESRIAGSTSWRDSRTHKLANQFGDVSGRGGDIHLSDLVGAGSVNWGKDGRKENGDWEKGAPGLREKGWQDISTLMNGSRKRKPDNDGDEFVDKNKKKREIGSMVAGMMNNRKGRYTYANSEEGIDQEKATATKSMTIASTPTPAISSSSTSSTSSSSSSSLASKPIQQHPAQLSSTTTIIPPCLTLSSPRSTTNPPRPPQIFTSLTLYLNGSTLPLISDHRLKTLWTQHGGTISLSLARRKVTHVILASFTVSSASTSPSTLTPTPHPTTTASTSSTINNRSKTETKATAGGPLSSSKIQKEITRIGGQGIKYVTAQWVIDCIDKGKRVSERNYVPDGIAGRIGGAGQRSVGEIFGKMRKTGE